MSEEAIRTESLVSLVSKGLPPWLSLELVFSDLLLLLVSEAEAEAEADKAEVASWRISTLLTLLELLDPAGTVVKVVDAAAAALVKEDVAAASDGSEVAVALDVSTRRPLVLRGAELKTMVPPPMTGVSLCSAVVEVEVMLATVLETAEVLSAFGHILRVPSL